MKALAATNLSFIYFLEGAPALLYSIRIIFSHSFSHSHSHSHLLLLSTYVSYVLYVCHKHVLTSARTVTLRYTVTLHCYHDITNNI